MKTITILITILIISGCAYFQEKAAPEIAEAINKYCINTPLSAREAVREEINVLLIDGASIKVTCPGD